MKTQHFNAVITALIGRSDLVPAELQDLSREELEEMVSRVTIAAGFIMRPQALPAETHWKMPEGALVQFLASLSRRQRRKLKAIAESLEAETIIYH